MTKRQRTLEKPAGNGYIWRANSRAESVRYSLVVIEVVHDDAPTGPLVSQIEIRGSIEVGPSQGLVDLDGQTVMLKLNDGRCLEAKVKQMYRDVAENPRGEKTAACPQQTANGAAVNVG